MNLFNVTHSEDKFYNIIIVISVVWGILYHTLLAFRPAELLTDRPFKDDSFYAFSISKNIANSKGITTSDGRTETNGFQPLYVFICTIPFYLTSDNFTALRIIHLIHLITHFLSGLMLIKLLKLLSDNKMIYMTGFALWMSSYYVLKETSNGLETSLYLLFILVCIWYYFKYIQGKDSLFKNILFGIILGFLTLTRIDSIFLCFALGIHYLLLFRNNGLLKSIKNIFIWTVLWLVITLPWWLYNLKIGHSLVPTSGIVQSFKYRKGSYFPIQDILLNLHFSITTLLDQALIIFATPLRIIYVNRTLILSWNLVRILVLIFGVIWIVKKIKFNNYQSFKILNLKFWWFYLIFLTALFLYYNFYFNVYWYINRYMAPAIILFVIYASFSTQLFKSLYTKLFLVASIFISVIIGGSTLYKFNDFMYTEQVNWIKQNASDSTWVAALQSGTLGYFHNKTINMDGKLNSDILYLNDEYGKYLFENNVEYFIDEDQLVDDFKKKNVEKYYYEYDRTANFKVLKKRDVPL